MEQKGFSLVEIVIAVALLIFVFIIARTTFSALTQSTQLNEYTHRTVEYIRLAQSKSVAGRDNLSHGIYFDINTYSEDRLILYEGASYGSRNQTKDEIIVYPKALAISVQGFSMLGTDVDINFTRSSGKATNVGQVTFTHVQQGTRDIIINSFGVEDTF